jgi:hypothetical protein
MVVTAGMAEAMIRETFSNIPALQRNRSYRRNPEF